MGDDIEAKIKKKLTPRIRRKYLPKSLTKEQRKAQAKSIIEGVKRPKFKDRKTRRSKWTISAEKYFGKDRSKQAISKKTGIPVKALKQIVERGEAAYYSSGSRPGQTPESWGVARMYAVLFGSPGARKADGDIVKKYKIPILKIPNTGKGIAEAEEITRIKTYPESYPEEDVKVIKDMTFSKGKDVDILGSMRFRSMLYSSDYDLIEHPNIKNVKECVTRFKNIIKTLQKRPLTYIGDIKCGIIKDWNIIDETAYVKNGKVYGYDYETSKNKLTTLLENGVITETEYKESLSILPKKPTALTLQKAQKELRFGTLRWKPKDILQGFIKLRTGEKYSLEKAILDPSLFKLDVIAVIDNDLFQEFSVIYDLRISDKRITTFPIKPEESIKRDIKYYAETQNWFKSIKRLFSLANYRFKYKQDLRVKKHAAEIIEKTYEILNSDLGIIYTIIQDIGVLNTLIEDHEKLSTEVLKNEILGFQKRLANVYSVNSYLKHENKILGELHAITIGLRKPEQAISRLVGIEEYFTKILSIETKKQIIEKGLMNEITQKSFS